MRFPIGARILFADANATVSDDLSGLHEGIVNGPPLEDDDGTVLYVPVFASRDNGREPTTIYVAASNIVNPGT